MEMPRAVILSGPPGSRRGQWGRLKYDRRVIAIEPRQGRRESNPCLARLRKKYLE